MSEPPILIAYDGSSCAKDAIAQAGGLFAGRSAVVLTVWRSAQSAGPAGLAAVPSDVVHKAIERLDEAATQQAEQVSRDGVELAGAAGLTARPASRRAHGSIWGAILDEAAGLDAAAIVVGSRGHSAIASALLGSVSSGVAHHASRPVTIVRAER